MAYACIKSTGKDPPAPTERVRNMTTKSKTKKHEPVRNENMYRAMVEIRRSSAASSHIVKSRKGTRLTNKKLAIRDYA